MLDSRCCSTVRTFSHHSSSCCSSAGLHLVMGVRSRSERATHAWGGNKGPWYWTEGGVGSPSNWTTSSAKGLSSSWQKKTRCGSI